MFFGTRSNKKDLLRNGDYIILLQSFTVTLSNGMMSLRHHTQTTISMAANGRLRFIPIRQLQCIMSAFVFLFKAIKLVPAGKMFKLPWWS
ncbi:hypothetical protein Ptr902_14109 [Pyrenophora tritici-repentis]|nr:hypothetical protein Ptr902_14109 [Pyrenophora tritici-repentis]